MVGTAETVWLGSGKTTSWSRHSVLIQSSAPLLEGDRLELVSQWMFGIQLVVNGRVIRCDERGAIVEVQRPRFLGSAAEFWNREVQALAAGRTHFADLEFTHRA